MPKAFLLTNKRYRIWKQIKETFQEEKRRLELLQKDQYSLLLPYDTSTDYSIYTQGGCLLSSPRRTGGNRKRS